MQRVGAYGCLNICVQERHRSTMVKAGILLPLAQLALVEGLEHEIQRFAVLALCNLATSDETHEVGYLCILLSWLVMFGGIKRYFTT